MAEFAQAIDYVLGNERGYSNDPHDPGGETNFGISKRSYPHLDIKSLTREDAITIYERDFWIFGGLTSQRIATKVFDEYVNSGHHSIRQAQLALGYLQAGPIIADGKYGAITEEHLNSLTCDTAGEQKFMDEFKARLCKMYCDDGTANPGESGDLMGWLRRAVKG
jgi:lysozyme family protein